MNKLDIALKISDVIGTVCLTYVCIKVTKLLLPIAKQEIHGFLRRFK